jgi:hypothetical protein
MSFTPRNDIVFAAVPVASTLFHALRLQKWEGRDRGDGYAIMSKPFATNGEIRAQLDRFAEQKITAWAGR